MKLQFSHLKMDEVKEGAGGGAGSPPAKAPEPKASEQPKPAASAAPAEAEGDSKFDDFGYEKTPAAEGDKKPEGKPDKAKPPADEKPKDDKVENPASGYDKKPVVEEEAPPAAEEPPPEKIDLGYELDIKELPAQLAKELQVLAKESGLSKEAAQKIVDREKAILKAGAKAKADAEREQKHLTQVTRAKWHEELEKDPNFGGENFAANIQRAERVLQEFMPDTKKRLTESKTMLPPYVMRDLARMADTLYATEKLEQGEPIVPPKDDDKEANDPLSFYG